MVAKKKKNTVKYRLFLFIPICVTILAIVVVSVGNYWVQIAEKYQEKKQLEDEIVALKEKEEQLKVDVERLEDPDYVARYAREKYMYSKEGEIILRLPEDDE